MNRFDLKEIIVENVESIVQKATTKTGEEVVLKHLKRRFYSWEDCLQINELKVARKCQHPNLLQLKEIVRLKQQDELCLVYEPVETSLLNYFQVYREKRIFVSEPNIRIILYQLLQVLTHLHAVGMLHRDLQPENIFITSSGQIKLGNLDSCRMGSKGHMSDYQGNRWYRSAEQVLKVCPYNHKVDIFAVGVIMAELYMNKNLFPSTDETDHVLRIFRVLGKISIKEWPQLDRVNEQDNVFKEVAQEMVDSELNPQTNKQILLMNLFKGGAVKNESFDLMLKMLKVCPFHRWEARELLKHSYFSKAGERDGVDMKDYQEKLYKNFNIGEQIRFEHQTKEKGTKILNNLFNEIKVTKKFM